MRDANWAPISLMFGGVIGNGCTYKKINHGNVFCTALGINVRNKLYNKLHITKFKVDLMFGAMQF